MAQVHGAYLEARARIVKRFAPDLVGFAANYNSANSRIIELKTRLGQPLDDDDRFVLTDLDQMSEDAERARQSETDLSPDQSAPSAARIDPTITSMRDFRRPTGTEGN